MSVGYTNGLCLWSPWQLCQLPDSRILPETLTLNLRRPVTVIHLLNAYCVHDTLHITIMVNKFHPCFMDEETDAHTTRKQ